MRPVKRPRPKRPSLLRRSCRAMMPFMLPAWATVVISLGAAAIGATAGLIGSWFAGRRADRRLTHQDSKQWRNLQLKACQELSDAWFAFRWLLYVPAHGFGEFDEKAQAQLGPLGTRCAQRVAGAILVLGGDAGEAAGEAAHVLDARIAQLKKTAVGSEIPWSNAARDKISGQIEEAEHAHEAFVKKARTVVQPPAAGKHTR